MSSVHGGHTRKSPQISPYNRVYSVESNAPQRVFIIGNVLTQSEIIRTCFRLETGSDYFSHIFFKRAERTAPRNGAHHGKRLIRAIMAGAFPGLSLCRAPLPVRRGLRQAHSTGLQTAQGRSLLGAPLCCKGFIKFADLERQSFHTSVPSFCVYSWGLAASIML